MNRNSDTNAVRDLISCSCSRICSCIGYRGGEEGFPYAIEEEALMCINNGDTPTQFQRMPNQRSASMPHDLMPPPTFSIIGHPSLQIYRFQLPYHLLHLLDYIVEECQSFVSKTSTGWLTYLYSLTKQDIALRDIPGLYEASRPITSFVKRTIEQVYGVDAVRIDRNQPHVLKYSTEEGSNHTGVELHHDKCDLTANIMLSRSNSYSGGGWGSLSHWTFCPFFTSFSNKDVFSFRQNLLSGHKRDSTVGIRWIHHPSRQLSAWWCRHYNW